MNTGHSPSGKNRVFYVLKTLGEQSGVKTEEVTESWRQFYNEDPHNLYSFRNIIKVIKFIKSKRMRWAKVCNIHGRDSNTYKILIENAGGKRSHTHRVDDNIKKYLKRNRAWDVDWIKLVLERIQWQALVTTVMNNRIP